MPSATSRDAAVIDGAPAGGGTEPFKARRGRPTRDQLAAIERTILQTGKDLFLANGYANTSMEAVATAVGVSKGTLYARYPTKPDLFRAIARDRLSSWRATASPHPAPSNGDVSAFLFAFGTALLERMQEPETASFDRLIMAEADKFPEVAEDFYNDGFNQAVRDLARELDLLTTDAGWPAADAAGVAETFISGLLGWWRMRSLLGTPSAVDRAAHIAFQVRLIIGGRAAW